MPKEDDLLKYYIQHTDERFDRLEQKVDKLLGFKMLLMGIAIAVSAIVSAGFQIAIAIAGGK